MDRRTPFTAKAALCVPRVLELPRTRSCPSSRSRSLHPSRRRISSSLSGVYSVRSVRSPSCSVMSICFDRYPVA
eukprot:12680385-Alexandrium_andersonii.AAC.1